MYYVTEVNKNKVMIVNEKETEGYFTLDEIALMPNIPIKGIKHTKFGVKASVYSGMDIGDLYIIAVKTPKARVRNMLNGKECVYYLDDIEKMVRVGRPIQGVTIRNDFVEFREVDPTGVSNMSTARATLSGYKNIALSASGELLKYVMADCESFRPGDVASVLLDGSVEPGYESVIILDDRIKRIKSKWIVYKGNHFFIDTTAVTSEHIMERVLDILFKAHGVEFIDQNRESFYVSCMEFAEYKEFKTPIIPAADEAFNRYAKKIIKSELKKIRELDPNTFVRYSSSMDKAKYLAMNTGSWGRLGFNYGYANRICNILHTIYKRRFITFAYVMVGGRNEELRKAWSSYLNEIGGMG